MPAWVRRCESIQLYLGPAGPENAVKNVNSVTHLFRPHSIKTNLYSVLHLVASLRYSRSRKTVRTIVRWHAVDRLLRIVDDVGKIDTLSILQEYVSGHSCFWHPTAPRLFCGTCPLDTNLSPAGIVCLIQSAARAIPCEIGKCVRRASRIDSERPQPASRVSDFD